MKTLLFIIILGFFGIAVSAQNWAPVGAKWHYDERFAFSGHIDFIRYTSEKDTIFHGQNCRKISKRHDVYCYERPEYELMFDRNDSVFFYDPQLDIFQLLYRFNAVQNDHWSLKIYESSDRNDTLNIHVDSTGTLLANGQSLKLLYVTYSVQYENTFDEYKSQIVEKFGDLSFMFNFWPFQNVVCDMNLSNGIRCYEDPVFGYYHFQGTDSCEYTITGIDPNSKSPISLYPNPAGEIVYILGLTGSVNYQISDLGGRILESGICTDSKIGIADLCEGVYVLSLTDPAGRKTIHEKIVKK